MTEALNAGANLATVMWPGHERRGQSCIGFGEREGRCPRLALTPARLWCHECEAGRRAHISAQFRRLTLAQDV